MFINFKSVFLLGLAAVSQANPVHETRSNHLQARAIMDHDCDGQTIASQDIYNAWQAGKNQNEYAIGNAFPKYFGNGGTHNSKVFPQIPDSTDLLEFPVLNGGTYTGWGAGTIRVVFRWGGENAAGQFTGQTFVGVMVHGTGNSYHACTAQAATPAPPPPAPPAPPAPPGPPRRRAVEVEY